MNNGDARATPAPKAETSELPPIEWRQPDNGVFETYSNFIHANWTAAEMRIRFAQLVPDPRGPDAARWSIEERTAVIVSWVGAKYLRDLLSEAIARYENLNGEIKQGKIP
jgi:hypothetical protein